MSSNCIEALPDSVVKQIAAGEVIASPASVVRELAENALDAKATRVTISLDPQLSSIRVVDNGEGMSLQNLRCCACPHTTSKIQSFADLQKIVSLGFRGEALHSMTQIASLEILSRPRNWEEAVGYRIQYGKGGQIVSEKPIAIAPGTIVTVSDIFADFPARRHALPKVSQQLKTIQKTVYEIALSHPGLTWQVYHGQRLWVHLSPGETPQQLLPQMLPKYRESDFQYVCREATTPEQGGQSYLELAVGLPDRASRAQGDWIKTAVNGRCVRLPELEQTIISGLIRTLPRDRYPICWLHLHTNPSLIDWNRHPAKAEIYLRHLNYWQEQTAHALNEALTFNPSSVPETVHNQRVGELIKAQEAQGSYQLSDRLVPEEDNELSILSLSAIAQVHNTYIIAEHPTGIWLIEQHIAHERLLYEQLEDEWQLVPHDPPLILNQLSQQQQRQLERLGLEIDAFGEQMWAVRTVPKILQARDDLSDAILELSFGGDLQTAQVATACRSAIRNGTPLSLSQMQEILDGWKRTRHPHTCPHGRPIYLSLEETSLAKFFRRHWVIGKSHGI
ncbi:MAG: DNA mismatch repair endonuclease MutL [Cyanobacteria bacterium SW_9_44_58]|nr:MAG: DNA mismatch repair endonuclease MutL [Cyanobacteria bacterium SW_9_44_58]